VELFLTGTRDLLEGSFNILNINKTTVFDFNSTLRSESGLVKGGILNIPFIVGEANATEIRSIFWIHELNDVDAARQLIKTQ
jgi:hypothetical protein